MTRQENGQVGNLWGTKNHETDISLDKRITGCMLFKHKITGQRPFSLNVELNLFSTDLVLGLRFLLLEYLISQNLIFGCRFCVQLITACQAF